MHYSTLLSFGYYDIINSALVVFFVIATYKDVRHREIPIILCGIITAISFALHMVFKTGHIEFIIAAAGLAIIYFIQCVLSTGGGGDVIMMTMLGFCIGITGSLVTIICSGVYTFVYIMCVRIKTKSVCNVEYPMAPFVFSGFMTYMVLGYTGILSYVFQLVYNIL